MSYTLFTDPILSGLMADEEVVKLFSVREDIETMIGIEAALALSQAKAGIISEMSAQGILNGLADFEPSLEKITEATERDGVIVPELVRQLRRHVGEPHGEFIHFGITSQDLIDTSLVIRIKGLIDILESRIHAIESRLERLSEQFGKNSLIGRTRMQAALPINVAIRIANWRAPLTTCLERLSEIKPRLLRLQFGGAVGTIQRTDSVLGSKGKEVAKLLAQDLKLDRDAVLPWHNDRSAIAEFAGWLSLVTGAIGKIGQDIVLMAQNEFSEIEFSSGGGSSAMPHKHNPVTAEMLITLARYNGVQLSGMHQALVHEQERSGAAWSLEWMLLPSMSIVAGASTRHAVAMLGRVTQMGNTP